MSTQYQKSGGSSQRSDNTIDGREKSPQKLKVMMTSKIIIIEEKKMKSPSPSYINKERLFKEWDFFFFFEITLETEEKKTFSNKI